MGGELCSSPVAAITEDHSLGAENNRHVLSHSPGGQKPEIKGSAGPRCSKESRGIPPWLRQLLWWPSQSLACGRRAPSLLSLSHGLPPAVSAFTWLLMRHQSDWVRTHPTPAGLHLNESHLQPPYIQMRSHAEVLGVRTAT